MSGPLSTSSDSVGPSILAVLKTLVAALRQLWTESSLADGRESRSSPARVQTSGQTDAVRLPSSGRLIRGAPGVTVGVSGRETTWGSRTESPTLRELIRTPLIHATAWHKTPGVEQPELSAGELAVRDAFRAAVAALRSDQALFRRIYDGRGYKTYAPSELDSVVQNASQEHIDFAVAMLLSEALEVEFALAGLDVQQLDTFDGWDRVAEAAAEQIGRLAVRRTYKYVARAFLNGPLLDLDGTQAVEIGRLADSPDGAISIGPVSDALLAELVEGVSFASRLPEGLDRSNTLVSFPVALDVDAPLEEYLLAYPRAAEVARRVVDVLRIVHSGDIGIGYVQLAAVTPHTPGIRPTYARDYQPEIAVFVPRRIAYGPPMFQPLGAEEIEVIRRLLPRHLAGARIRGLDVAMHRFRESYERYHPEDPERLLDVGIAFEAIFLNDGKDKELGYRLRLRAARFLHERFDDRNATFEVLKRLYDARSEIAHGASESVTPAKRAQYASTLETALQLLRLALREVLDGRGPEGLSEAATRDWWRKIELGPVS